MYVYVACVYSYLAKLAVSNKTMQKKKSHWAFWKTSPRPVRRCNSHFPSARVVQLASFSARHPVAAGFAAFLPPPTASLCGDFFVDIWHPGCPFFETRPWWFGNAGPLKSPLWFTELKCLIFQLKGVLFVVASAGSFSQSNQRVKDQQLKSIYRALVGWPGSPSKVRHIEVLKLSGW